MTEVSKNQLVGGKGRLSRRGWANVGDIMPKIGAAVKERTKLTSNPNIDLASAENWLIRSELIDICKHSINEKLVPLDFSYPRAFAGFPDVLEAFASFFNAYFNPKIQVETSHIVTAPGAAHCLDALFYNICDPGDSILVAAPYWSLYFLLHNHTNYLHFCRWLRFHVSGTIIGHSHSRNNRFA
jgi:gliotoxin/aspirochlorine biosynthesis aminotransferase